MNNSLALNDWSNLVNAMVGGSFHNQRVIEGKPFKLTVVVEGNLQGIIVKQDGKVLFKEIFEIPRTSGMNYRVKLTRYEKGGEWLQGYHKEQMDKFFMELRDIFYTQVILGIKGGENCLFYCPDIPTLQKWSKVIGLRALL